MTLSINRILLSLGMLVFVGALVAGATGAFFSDTETSTGNTFTAGDIDLQIDNESYAIDYNIPGLNDPQGDLVFSEGTSWDLADLTDQLFFNFSDLKPGDFGEDTISVHVGSNDAWMCASATITADLDNNCTEPEVEDGDAECVAAGVGNTPNPDEEGELDNGLQFAFWVDDGDNVLETDEQSSIFISGTLADMGEVGGVTLADSQGGILGAGVPIPGDETFWIGKAWCFGDLSESPLADDSDFGPLGADQLPGGEGDDADRGTGILCDGSQVNNVAQTDSVVGNITFYAEQARNNEEFLCSNLSQPE